MKFSTLVLLVLSAVAAVAAEAKFKISEFTFQRPEKWESVETASAMRKAQLKINDAEKKTSAEIVFFHFGAGGGGGLQANIDRWYRQFEGTREAIKARSEEAKVGKHKITYVQAEGTFNSGMPGGPTTPMKDYALRGAIIESSEGDVFVKLTGPAALVKASEADFKKMVESALK